MELTISKTSVMVHSTNPFPTTCSVWQIPLIHKHQTLKTLEKSFKFRVIDIDAP